MKKGLFAVVIVLCCGFVFGEERERDGHCRLSFHSSAISFDVDIKEDVFLNLIPVYKEYKLAEDAVSFGINCLTNTFDSFHGHGDWVWNSFKKRENDGE